MSAGDEPIVASGGPHHITVKLAGRAPGNPQTFSLTPKDPAVPFKEIVITDGTEEVFRWPLSGDWEIKIV